MKMHKGTLFRSARSTTDDDIRRRIDVATRAWVATARVGADGRRASASSPTAIVIFAVSVNRLVSPTINARLNLMEQVVKIIGSQVEPGVSSLWVFPGGYFGFDSRQGAWLDLRENDVQQLQRDIQRVFEGFPRKSILTFGVDYLDQRHLDRRQQAWVLENASGDTIIRRITRERSPLSQRIFSVGQLHAAAFVCGEFTGSRTFQNGPFFVDATGRSHYLDEPERQLRECHILIDLAHQRVSGSVHASPNRRMVHQRQMERFSRHGVAVLAHHHAGKKSRGRPQSKHQSNWVVFPQGDWLSDGEVVEIQ